MHKPAQEQRSRFHGSFRFENDLLTSPALKAKQPSQTQGVPLGFKPSGLRVHQPSTKRMGCCNRTPRASAEPSTSIQVGYHQFHGGYACSCHLRTSPTLLELARVNSFWRSLLDDGARGDLGAPSTGSSSQLCRTLLVGETSGNHGHSGLPERPH